jgi:seryl-tRNA synthetase
MTPNSGDIVVQAVAEDLVIQDIRFSVPRGRSVVIPGNLACDSRDLGKLMSQKRIMKLDSNPRLDSTLSTQPKSDLVEADQLLVSSTELVELKTQLQKARTELRASAAEVHRLIKELGESRAECGRLLAEGNQLRAEIAKLKEEDSKLSTILSKIESMPTQVVVQASSKDVPLDGSLSEEDVPVFVPTFGPTKKMAVKEDKVDGSSAQAASKALKELRKGKSR